MTTQTNNAGGAIDAVVAGIAAAVEAAPAKVSARGVAIKHFTANLQGLRDQTMSLEVFKTTVTADLAAELNMDPKDCGYLFNKARRAAERSGKCDDLDFGAAQRAQPIVKAAKPVAEGATDGGPVATEFSVVELLDGNVVGDVHTYGKKGVAAMQTAARNKRGGNWIAVEGTPPVAGTVYAAQVEVEAAE